jgi:hypothetical protein
MGGFYLVNIQKIWCCYQIYRNVWRKCNKKKPPPTLCRWGLNGRNKHGKHHAYSRINSCKPDAKEKEKPPLTSDGLWGLERR